MNHIRRIDLSKRLVLGFGILLTLLVAIVGMSIYRLGQQASAMDKVTTLAYPRVEAAQAIAFAVSDSGRIARNMILLTDKSAEARNQTVYDQDRALIDTKMATLDKLTVTDEGRTLLANLKRAADAYFPFIEEVIVLGRKDDDKAATELLFGPRLETQTAYLGAVRALLEREKTMMAEDSAASAAAHDAAVRALLLAAVLACLFGVFCAWAITRSITRPMHYAVKVARAVAAGDLTSAIVVDHTDEAGQLLAALRDMNAHLVDMVGSVRQSSDSIATGSGQIATGNADLSQRTEQQASSLQQTAASMAQMHTSVTRNAETARTATQLAASASAVALQGGEVVAKVISTMDHISASSKKIADIVGVIDGIAFQTNILALNAAVEAARAGEQGRGFAVVASEVRSLAQRSAESAKQIKSLIAESVETVDSGSRLVGGAGTTMSDIVGQVRRVADLIGEMSASTEEQSKGIGQVTDAVGQLDRVTQQNAALVEESAAAADSLKQQAVRMSELVSVFKLAPSGLGQSIGVAAAAPATPRAVIRSSHAAVATAVRPALGLSVKAPVRPVVARPATPVRTPIVSASSTALKPTAPTAAAPRVTATAEQDWESF